jgi:hypothetical protein
MEIINVCVSSVGLYPLAIATVAFGTPLVSATIHYLRLFEVIWRLKHPFLVLTTETLLAITLVRFMIIVASEAFKFRGDMVGEELL